MKIVSYPQLDSLSFDTDTVKGVKGRVAIGKADGAQNFCMRVFEIDGGGYTPRHSHEWEHEIFVHSGEGEVLCEGEWVAVSKGHVIFIPGDKEHQIRNTGQEKLVFVCLIPAGPPEI